MQAQVAQAASQGPRGFETGGLSEVRKSRCWLFILFG